MNVTITTPRSGGLQTEFSIEQNIRRCIDDGMLGEDAPGHRVDVEVSFVNDLREIPTEFSDVFANSSIPDAAYTVACSMEDPERRARWLALFGMEDEEADDA